MARRRTRIGVFLAAVGAVSPLAASVVGSGTAGSCDEAALDTALAGAGTITFDCGGPATITFTTTKTITQATTIDGANLITLSGGGTVKLFDVTGGGLTVENLALVDGHDSASDIGAAAIDASADVTISGSTVSGFHVTHGGCPAINMSGATLTIENSTVSGNVNEAPAAGFAVCANNTSTMTIRNSTFSGNTGGAFLTSGTATLTNVTAAGNSSTGAGNTGGYEIAGGSVTFADTIIANNAGDAGQCAIIGGTVTDGGNNLQFPDAACNATIPVKNPLLGPLANNGGPTRTMALLPGSPAVDAGSNGTCLPTDQRGIARTDGDGDGTVTCDIGAYEAPEGINRTFASVPVLDGRGFAALALLLAGAGFVAVRRSL